MRHRPLVATKTLCKFAAILLVALLCYRTLFLDDPFSGRDVGDSRATDADGRRDDDCTDRFPSPYVTEDPPHPDRDPSWGQLVTVVSPPEEGARAVDQRPTWEVHTEGLWHRAAYVVVRVGNSMLMQRRSENKWTYPGLWEYSAAETMEGDESFLEAANRAVGEEMGDLLREGVPSPELKKCCGPITYVWEGEMPYMYLREKTVVEVFNAYIDDNHLSEESLEAISSRIPQGESSNTNSSEPVEVDGWMMMPIKTLREEASLLKAKKYAPWLLVALDQCRVCWKHI